MILAADIGGTKTLLALFDPNDQEFRALKQTRFSNVHYNSMIEIIGEFISEIDEKITVACFGVAGPIEDGVCRATNLPWVIDSQKIKSQFKFNKVLLINDLEANAIGIEALTIKDLHVLRKGVTKPLFNKALISAGTGLGQAMIFYDGKNYIPSASEGGHTDFAPQTEDEFQLLRYLQKKYSGHVSYERLLSGMGLVNIYRFLIESGKCEESAIVREAMQKEHDAEVISGFGKTKKCDACVKAVNWFCSIYGAQAGNLALQTFCLSGIYIGGGIAPKMIEQIEQSNFLTSFTNKGRFSTLLNQIPINIILREDTALLGSLLKARSLTEF